MACRILAVPAAAGALAAALGGCAAPGMPAAQAMGAGPACDLRVDVGAEHRCAVRHVAPAVEEQLITNSTRAPVTEAVSRNH